MIIIPVSHLSAISLFAPKNDTRSYLNGVAIKDGYLVATDGIALAAIPIISGSNKDIIIPIESIISILKNIPANQKHYATVNIDIDNNCLIYNNIKIEFQPIVDCKFPQWKRIVPDKDLEIQNTKCFNWSFLVKFQKAGKILTNSSLIYLLPHGLNGATVIIPGMKEFIGVVSPINTKD